MSCLRVFSLSAYICDDGSGDVLIVGDNKADLKNSLTSVLVSLKLDAANEELLQMAVDKLSPGLDNGDSASLFVKCGDVARKVSVGVLSTACSRHNSPAKPHVLSALVGTSKASVVVLVPSSNDHVFAQVCAVARQYPTFNCKRDNMSVLTNVTRVVDANSAYTNIVVKFPGAEDAALLQQLSVIVDDIQLCGHLVDMPTNYLNCKTYVEEAEAVHARLKSSVTVGTHGLTIIRGEELEKRGFGGLWGVGKASDNLPALVVLSYTPVGAEGQPSTCMVGKGIVYDTGGLSIKVPPNMAGMKRDMGGSAAVISAFDALVRSGACKKPVHALLCMAENAVSEIATRPDDIHTLYSGKTVEVNNTDAEGRLVLADGCAYAAKHLFPSVIFDIATLTGAQLIATGKKFGAVMTNSDKLEDLSRSVGVYSGDLVHPIPYCPEFFRAEFASSVADMKNSVADRGNAQCSCAGQFIGNHIEDYLNSGGEWMHIDMAGPVSKGERATGYGVGLLYGLVSKLQ
jgi:probable aminopeptidase NPEPL1